MIQISNNQKKEKIMRKIKKKILKPKNQKEKSFTLLELLIVIAVIAILAAVIMVSLGSVRQSAWESRGLQFSQNIKSTLATDLVGEWTFDDQTNPGRDDSGNGNNGTVYTGTTVCNYNPGPPAAGCPVWSNTPPNARVRGALQFNGSNNYITIPQPSVGMNPNLFTIEGFIRPDNQTSFFVTPQSCGLDQYLRYDPSAQRLVVHVAQNGDTNERDVPSKNGSVPLNKWTHFAVMIDNLKIRIYINGELDNDWDTEISICNWSNFWLIGQRGNNIFFKRISRRSPHLQTCLNSIRNKGTVRTRQNETLGRQIMQNSKVKM